MTRRCFAALVALFTLILVQIPRAQGGLTIVGFPIKLAAGPDYATDVLVDPWDMSNGEDISIYPDERPGWGSDFAVSNGRAGGTTVLTSSGTADTSLVFLYRGFYDTVNTGRSGRRYPINPPTYSKLSFKLSSGAAGQVPQIYWFHRQNNEPGGGGLTGNGDGVFLGTATAGGDQIYMLDMNRAFSAQEGGEAWAQSGTVVRGLRIDPNHSAVGHQVFFDWVRLTRGDSDSAAATKTITWSGGSGASTVDVIDAAGTVFNLAKDVSDTSLTWNYGILPPGAYTLRVTRGGSTASQAFTINTPPLVKVTDPDETGGDDFATKVLGNAWDMNDSADVERTANLTSSSFSGGQFNGTSNTSGDPQVWTLYGFSNPRPIDTNRYRYLTYTLTLDRAFNLGAGSVARVLWGSQQGRPDILTISKDIIVWPGTNAYTIDLGSLSVGTDGGIESATGSTAGETWSSKNMYHFRLDPHEFPEALAFHVDEVKLSAVDEAPGSFTIKYSASDGDGDSGSVSLFYDDDTNPDNGRTQFASGLSLTSNGSSTWSTSGVAAGHYYIYAQVSDGTDTRGSYSTGRVHVTSASAPSSSQNLTLSVAGTGTVIASPTGTSCGSGCTTYDANTVVTLTVTPGSGAVFDGWSGDADCRDASVTMNANRSCTAVFVTKSGKAVTRGAIDLNGDGGADSFRYIPSTGEWVMDLSDRLGATYPAASPSPWGAGWTVKAADFNGDGLTDFFLIRSSTGEWYKAINNGGGGFRYFGSTWSPGWVPYVLDLNGDGKSDLFIFHPSTGEWYRCTSTGDGTVDFAYVGGAWSPGWSIYPVDWNADGRADLFLFSSTTGEWYRATNDGASGFTYVGGGWDPAWEIYPGDYNVDGRSDLFLFSRSSGLWFVALSFGDAFLYRGDQWDPGWRIFPGDYNGDGATDLFVLNSAGTWYECLSNGSGGFSYAGGSWDSGSYEIYVTDINVDGKNDLLLYQSSSGDYYQAINIGTASFFYGSGNWGLGWTIVATRTRTP